ncbi:MAG: group 1 glycosyl transferase, partial [Thaumarchaeota archaeon]
GRVARLTFIDKYLTSDEILKIASIADIILLPYRDKYGVYSVSGILHLSMGSFKPLIGSRVPRLIELYQFAPRVTIPPKKPAELVKKLKWMMNNYDYAVAYMAHLYSYAVRTQWLRMARRHLNLYHELLRSKS